MPACARSPSSRMAGAGVGGPPGAAAVGVATFLRPFGEATPDGFAGEVGTGAAGTEAVRIGGVGAAGTGTDFTGAAGTGARNGAGAGAGVADGAVGRPAGRLASDFAGEGGVGLAASAGRSPAGFDAAAAAAGGAGAGAFGAVTGAGAGAGLVVGADVEGDAGLGGLEGAAGVAGAATFFARDLLPEDFGFSMTLIVRGLSGVRDGRPVRGAGLGLGTGRGAARGGTGLGEEETAEVLTAVEGDGVLGMRRGVRSADGAGLGVGAAAFALAGAGAEVDFGGGGGGGEVSAGGVTGRARPCAFA